MRNIVKQETVTYLTVNGNRNELKHLDVEQLTSLSQDLIAERDELSKGSTGGLDIFADRVVEITASLKAINDAYVATKTKTETEES